MSLLEYRRVNADPDRQERIAEWCNGRVRGMMLEPGRRIVQFDSFGAECNVEVGDYVVRLAEGMFVGVDEDQLCVLWAELGGAGRDGFMVQRRAY